VRFCHFESSCHFDERRNLIGPKQLYWTPLQCALLSFRVQLSFRRKEKSYWTETTILDTVTMCAFVISSPVVISTRGEILLDRNNYTGHRHNVRFCHFESSCHFDVRRNLIGPKQLYWTPSQCALLSFRLQLSFRREEKSYWTETTILDTVTMCAFVISSPPDLRRDL
jgi:hypothetical protein